MVHAENTATSWCGRIRPRFTPGQLSIRSFAFNIQLHSRLRLHATELSPSAGFHSSAEIYQSAPVSAEAALRYVISATIHHFDVISRVDE